MSAPKKLLPGIGPGRRPPGAGERKLVEDREIAERWKSVVRGARPEAKKPGGREATEGAERPVSRDAWEENDE